MADRNQYLQMRRSNQWDLNWFFLYYLEKKKDSPLSHFNFQQTFQMYFQMNSPQVIEKLDREFEVQKIEDSNGNLLYIN